MGIIIEKQSKCAICNTVLDNSKDYVIVPPLISNKKDNLFIFSDAGIHIDCINSNKFKNELIHHINLYNQEIPPSKQKCFIDGRIIDNPENYLFFGLLTSDESEELYNFNYLIFNKKNIQNWRDLNKFLLISGKFLSDNKWESLNDFNKLKYIVEKVKEYK